MADPTIQTEEAALSLAMAVVTASPGPLLLLDGECRVVAASTSFCEAFDISSDSAKGLPLADLGSGEWNIPQLRDLLDATASGAGPIDAYEVELRRPRRGGRSLLISAQRLAYEGMDEKRLLLAATDVTQARADAKIKDDANRQNVILLQEVRHRVANSLQIIASVLLQNAKRTGSDETRGHLRDAHNRVMSVAALERQLSWSQGGDVELRAYFIELCNSIAASMIADGDQITMSVTGVGGLVDARVSVSLGLIVTELVINALKHAFPDERTGGIVVDCAVRGPNWVLSVSDDGVGMPTDPAEMRIGLGTSIIEALARQLEAVVVVERTRPGTRTSIAHDQVLLIDQQDLPAAAAFASAAAQAER
jgi:two-component sensor histidine kinase